jgi:hypothetical protein
VYDEDTGVQTCLCHDVCTPEFLQWEKERFEDLSKRAATSIPMSKIPPWESVGALRSECVKRCVAPQQRQRLNKTTTEAQKMQRWLLAKCRRECVELLSFPYAKLLYSFITFLIPTCLFLCRRMHTYNK